MRTFYSIDRRRLIFLGLVLLCAFLPYFAGNLAAQVLTAEDHYKQGRQKYIANDDQGALESAKAAILLDPNFWRAYQLAGYASFKLKASQASAEYCRQSLALHSDNVALQAFVDKNFPKLESVSPEAIPPPPVDSDPSPSGPPAQSPDGARNPTVESDEAKRKPVLDPHEPLISAAPVAFGIRLQPVFALVDLKDFKADIESSRKYTEDLKSLLPDIRFAADMPANYFSGEIEPVIQLDRKVEIGFLCSVLPVGTVSESYIGSLTSLGTTYTITNSLNYDVSALFLGLDVRYLVDLGNGFCLSLAGGPLLVPMNVKVRVNATAAGGGNTSTLIDTGDFSADALGGRVQMGLDCHLGKIFVISPTVGFQAASAKFFKGAWRMDQTTTIGGSITTSSSTKSGRLQVIKSPYGYMIALLEDGQTPPSDSRPLEVDLSGLQMGIQLSAFF